MTLRQKLLLAGVVSSILYVVVDLICAALYPGYSILDQAISELSAIGAPAASRRLWSTMGPVYEILVIVFGIGVYRWADRNRVLRVTGALLVAFGASGVLWAFFPMHSRGAEMTWSDVGHIVMSIFTVLFILVFIGVGAFALGRRFRVYSWTTILVLVFAGAITFSWADHIARGEPTPWLGVMERINVYGYLLWIAVLSVALLRKVPSSSRQLGVG